MRRSGENEGVWVRSLLQEGEVSWPGAQQLWGTRGFGQGLRMPDLGDYSGSREGLGEAGGRRPLAEVGGALSPRGQRVQRSAFGGGY